MATMSEANAGRIAIGVIGRAPIFRSRLLSLPRHRKQPTQGGCFTNMVVTPLCERHVIVPAMTVRDHGRAHSTALRPPQIDAGGRTPVAGSGTVRRMGAAAVEKKPDRPAQAPRLLIRRLAADEE